MDPFPETFIRTLHDQPWQVVLAATGGGSRAIAELLAVPGGSRILAEAVVPYSTAALTDWLGSRPEQFCTAQTARSMAMQAFLRMRKLATTGDRPSRLRSNENESSQSAVGLACTASLASEPPKRGAHRIHVACQTETLTACASLELKKGYRTRAVEEQLAAQLLLNQLAIAGAIPTRLPLELLPEEQIKANHAAAPAAWTDLLLDRRRLTGQRGSTPTAGGPVPASAIFPGAFHPLHAGHLKIAEVAEAILGQRVEYEISLENVDKPPLDFIELTSRAGQFGEETTLWFTRSATFLEKSRLFPQATFVVGVDTVQRIADARYYGDEPARRDAAVAEIAAAGCRFLVFGRASADGFRTLRELDLPPTLCAHCREVSAEQFRADISSSSLRRAAPEDAEET